MPTVDGLKRRGIVPQTIRDFTLQVGYTKTEHEYDWSILLSINRKLLDPVTRRVFFVPDPVELRVDGAPTKSATIPYHPQADLGSRAIDTSGSFFLARGDIGAVKKGSVFRLMDLYNVELTSELPDPRAKYAGDELLEGTRKFQWVTPDHAEVKVLAPDALFDDKGEFNKESLKEIRGYAERAFSGLKTGDIVQFPRFGFCRVDGPGTCVLSN